LWRTWVSTWKIIYNYKTSSEEPIATTEETIEQPAATTEKKSIPATKVTSTVKKTKPKKDPGRVEAGKRHAEHYRRIREQVKIESLRKNTQISDDQSINQSINL